MFGRKKGMGMFSASALVVGSILFVPHASAYVREHDGRPAAPSREQQQIQLQLAERTRNLAEQYTNRRFGTEEQPIADDEPAPVQEPASTDEALERASRRRSQRERFTSTESASADVRARIVSSTESVRSEPVARDLPRLPSSGLGLSVAAVALGGAGALRGRRKFSRALS